MADERIELRRIHWKEVFLFTQVFKSFRMAIQPSKMVLALAAIVLLFVGGWVLDVISGAAGVYVAPGEIARHAALRSDRFDEAREDWADQRLPDAVDLLATSQRELRRLSRYQSFARSQNVSAYFSRAFDAELQEYNQENDPNWSPPNSAEMLSEARQRDAGWAETLDAARDHLDDEIRKIRQINRSALDRAEKTINEDLKEDEDAREDALDELDSDKGRLRVAITDRKLQFAGEVRAIRGTGVFETFFEYELSCVSNAIGAVWEGNFTGGLDDYADLMAQRGIAPKALDGAAVVPVPADPGGEGPGFAFFLLMAYRGGLWLLDVHPFLGIVFAVYALAICALFGGAVNRIAAVHFAREEKISAGQALKFALGKFGSFLVAPLVPIGLIIGIGALLAVGGLVGSIPILGEIIMGALFILALIGGLVIAFLLIGLVAGVGLMYPTIAVEGSDCFDSMSRSFSYVYSRPWRAAWYGLVALVYGVITYLFVRLFIFLALVCTHYFVQWGVFTGGGALHPQADKLDVMWTRPQFDSLIGPFSWQAMSATETIGAFLLGIWVFLVAASAGAFLLSYAASATTVIYYLLRRQVDATDLDDVYIEDNEEDELAAEVAEAAQITEQPSETDENEAESDSNPQEGDQQ